MQFVTPQVLLRLVEALGEGRAACVRFAALALVLVVSAAPALAACPAPYNGAGNSVCSIGGSKITCNLDAAGNTVDPIYYSESYTSGTRHFRAFGVDDVNVKFCYEVEVQNADINTLDVIGPDRTDNIYLNYSGNPTTYLDIMVDGNNGGDIIDGSNTTTSVDELFGDLGDDTIDGKIGDDYIYGGGGVDDLTGGDGVDTIHGDAGNDTIRGNADGDYLYGDGDIDTIYGQDGADYIEGGTEVDYVKAGDGNDEVWGGTGADLLCGDAGPGDLLYGEAGIDDLYAGSDTEYVDGGADADSCSGYGTAYATFCSSLSTACAW